MTLPGVVPPKPIPLKERAALVFVERARLDVKDGAFVAINADGTRVHIPVGGVACLMLEPGARISHSAVALASRAGTLVTWVGEAGVRLYAAGQPGGARSDKLLWQASLALDPEARLRVVREMYRVRFGEKARAFGRATTCWRDSTASSGSGGGTIPPTGTFRIFPIAA